MTFKTNHISFENFLIEIMIEIASILSFSFSYLQIKSVLENSYVTEENTKNVATFLE